MKIALCTTTVNIPHVLKLYRACDPDVKMFVAIDQKTPEDAVNMVQHDIDNADVIYLEAQQKWKCSALIGWNSIQRRNIAFLEALKWGADVIVSIDDDNAPTSTNYFEQITEPLRRPFAGIAAVGKNGWFDVGHLLQPKAPHRGYPRQIKHDPHFEGNAGAKVGASAGICLGDPDIDSVTRIALAPEVHQISLLLEAGVTVAPSTWTVFNSQNTAVLRELIPAWGMIPFVGRMDDIYASLICQRAMRERGMCVHFGKPYVFQQRNAHDLVKDLRGEIDGYDNVAKLADLLDHVQLAGKSVIADCRRIWETLNHADWMPGRAVSAMAAYLDDCETVL